MSRASDAAGMLASPRAPQRWASWAGYAGYAACAWALAFAAVSFYWAAGGTIGAESIGPALTSLALARDPEFIAILWITGALKLIAGLFALVLARPGWLPLPVPRWLLLLAGWCAGAALALYGGASFVQHALMVSGIIAIPAGLGATAARWHLLLWDPYWLLGGILFAAATWNYGQRTAARGVWSARSPRRASEDAEQSER